MNVQENTGGPVVLQLHELDPSCVQIDVSEYREAFLSPTRELLLLHSHQNEAFLLPLSRGDSYFITSDSGKYDCEEGVNSVPSSACRSDSQESFPSTSESSQVEVVSSNGFSPQSIISQSNTCPFIFDVNSLAWGSCGDVYKQHTETPFREFLFVVGDRGVTIHAFRQPDDCDALVQSPSKGENELGKWVEWGPSSASSFNNKTPKDISLTSKKWLWSFLSSAETKESEGIIVTRFPEKSKLPYSASVVSFLVSFNEPCMRGFYSGARSSLDGASEGNLVPEPYVCQRVFSGTLWHLIGFVLSTGCESSTDPSFKKPDIVIIVVLVDFFGLHWLYSTKLPQTDLSSETEWVDFQISDKFLISLNKFGSVLFHGATTGEYITYLNTLQIYGVHPSPRNVFMDGNGVKQDDVLREKLDYARNFAGKHRFRRLIGAPYSSLFAVVDECGVAYVVCATDHVLENYTLVDKLLPQNLRLGLLAPWDVGYCDIAQQKIFSDPEVTEKSATISLRSQKLSLSHNYNFY